MKKQLQGMLLSISLIFHINIVNLEQMQAPKFPSVSDVFSNRSSEEIINEVQEAQRFFESLSPEEMAEVEKMVEETLKHMSPQDLEDIQNIATMVEPHLDIPKEKASEPAAESQPVKDTAKSSNNKIDDIDIDTNNIMQLIADINKQVDEVAQKTESSKELSEEIMHRWASKISLDSMMRQILALKETRLAKKLSSKQTDEDKDLVEALQDFHKDLTGKNDKFKVEDSFGIQESRSIEQRQLAELQGILAMYEKHLDKITPLVNKFLTKHDPEKLELAKAAEQRAQKSLAHAQDAEKKRGSAPAQPLASNRGSISTERGLPQARQKYQDQIPSISQSAPQQASTSSKNISKTDFPTSTKSQTTPQNKSKTDDSTKKDLSPYNLSTESLEDHVDIFDKDHENAFSSFLKNDVASYPNPKDADKVPANPAEREQWLNNEFSQYESSIKSNVTKFTQELHNINDSLNNHLENISKISSHSELTKLADDKNLKKIKARIQRYKNAFNASKQKIQDIYTDNISTDSDPLKSPLTLVDYKQRHRDFTMSLESNLEAPLESAENAISRIEKRIKRQKQKAVTN